MRIGQDVLGVLDASRTHGSHLFLPGQLDRKVYLAVNNVLELAGGAWSRREKAHVFPGDAAEAIEGILLTGEISNAKREFDAFYTPSAVVARLMALADVRVGQSVLEPSSGEGAIALALADTGATVESLEIRDVPPWWSLRSNIYHRQVDFLGVEPRPEFDRVVMNPPFSRQQDMIHVSHAFQFLKMGGRLVSVMSPAFEFRTTLVARALPLSKWTHHSAT
jgi:predicted RNA methylase